MIEFNSKQFSEAIADGRVVGGEEIAIPKSAISPLGECKGKVDKDSGRVYLRFCGALGADGLYHGQVWFDAADPPSGAETFSLSSVVSGKKRRTAEE